MQLPITEELHVLVFLVNEVRERLERLGVWRPAVLHRSTIVIGVLINIIRIVEMLLVERVTEREVGRIPRHGILHRLDVKLKSRDREVLSGTLGDRILHDTVLLLFCLADVHSLFQPDVLIKRIILGRGLLVAVGIIDGSMQLDLLGHKTSQIGLNCDIVLVIVVQSAVRETLIHRTKALGFLMEAHIKCSDITHVECHRGLGSPTALGIKVSNTQFIDPNDTTLGRR